MIVTAMETYTQMYMEHALVKIVNVGKESKMIKKLIIKKEIKFLKSTKLMRTL